MKTSISSIVAILLSSFAFAQTPLKLVKEKVGNPEILKNWEVGETKNLHDASIFRVEGENNYDFITNISYTAKSRMLNPNDNEVSASTMLAAANSRAGVDEPSAQGGQLALFFSRPSEELAQPSNFSVLVLDENGAVIWSDALEMQQPYYYRWEIWYYYQVINLPVAVGESFIIKINDAGTRDTFTFLVNRTPDSFELQQPDLSLKQISF